jgi:hypothetical protein
MNRAPWIFASGTLLLLPAILTLAAPSRAFAQERPATAGGDRIASALHQDVTFTRDVAPILQENCQRCHRPNGVAPMPLVTYRDVQPWAPRIKFKTQLGLLPRAGAMPPYYVEREIGIQHYKDDLRLSEDEIATLAAWADAGAPEGRPEDLPPARVWGDSNEWTLGEPDLVVRTQEFFVPAGSPDWWGDMESVPTGLTEDRYVAAVEIREVNDVVTQGAGAHGGGHTAVGGRFIVHHMIWNTRVIGAEGDAGQATSWPVHELGRNPDRFDERAGKLLRAGSSVTSSSVHLHSNGRDTRGRLEIAFYLHPVGYTPEYRPSRIERVGLGDGLNIDIRANEAGQELHAYAVLEEHTKILAFEPHLHAPGARMCLEAIWGNHIETLTCAGYDHNWVRQYTYDDDHAPLLPRGTILHIVGFMDSSPTNPNVTDTRNWAGSGNRTVTNMFIDLGSRVALTDEQFVREMAERRERLKLGPNDHVIGCPLCQANLPVLEGGRGAGAGPRP